MEDIKDNISSSSRILESGEFATDSIRLHDSRIELPKCDHEGNFGDDIVAETHMKGRKVNAYIPYHVATKHLKKVLHDLACTKRALSSSKDTEKILQENQETLKTAINELYGQHTKKISQWSHKVTGLKSHNIDLMKEVNELIQFNLNFRSEKEEEVKQLKESYNKERRRQLESLENRESDLMSQYRLHLANAKKSLSDKIDRLQKKNNEISEQFESIVKEKDVEISGMVAQLKDSELQLTTRASEVEQLSCKVEEITVAFDLHKNESNLVVENLKKQLDDHVQELTLQLSEKNTAFDDFKHKSASEIEDVKKQWDLQVHELNKKVTEKTLAYNNLRHNSDLKIDGLKKQRDENIKDLTIKLDQQSHDFDSFRDESKLDMEKLIMRHQQEVESLSTKLEEKSEAFEKSKLEIKRLIQMQDEQVEALTTKLQSFESERNNLQESWKQDKEQIELSYNEKIQKLEQQILLSESEAEKHAQAIEDMKVTMEEEMKSFKAKKEEEKAKIIQASDNEKRALSEKLEELTKRTEMKIRSSLSKIEFHRNEQQRLENVADKLEKDKQVMEENMDSAKAEIRRESQEKMQLTMSERELTITELNTVKRKRKSLNDEMRKLSSTMTTGLGATSKESIPPVASDNVIPKETTIHDTVGPQKNGPSKTLLSTEQSDSQKDIPHNMTKSSKPDDPMMTSIKSNQDLEEQISQLQEEKRQLVTQRDVLEKKIVHMNKENTALSEKSKGYLEELVSTQRELVDRTNTLKVKESLVESLEQESANLKEANGKLKDELTDLESNMHSSLDVDSRLEIQKYKDKLMLAEQELEYSESANRHEIQQYKEKVIKLESAVEEAQKTTAKIENELALREANFKKSIAESTKEIEELQETIKNLEKQYEDAALNVEEESASEYQEKIAELEQSLQEKQKEISDKEKKIKSLEKEFSSLQDELLSNGGGAQTANRGSARGVSTRGGPVRGARGATRGAANNARAQRLMETQISTLKSRNETLNNTLSNLEKDVTDLKKAVRTAEAEAKKAKESGGMNAKDSKKLEIMKKTLDDTRAKLEKSETAVQKLEKDSKELTEEVSQLKKEKKALESVAGDTASLKEQVVDLSDKVKSLQLENAEAIENYNSERILRKKYYNQIEDMKGKIRVFCRARPISSSEIERGNFNVILSPDEYTLTVQTKRGPRDFTFDQVFTPDTRGGQEHIFEDVKMLIQSAADGYNVCIFAYGQTGSGKTFTMIGGGDMPGIAPRAFAEIFDLLNSNVKQFSYQVTLYMVELYNDMLLDLLDKKNNAKLDIKKDKKGMVFVTNITIKDAADTEKLMKHFDEGSKNRHVASTKMNAESSRSHLIISVVIETTNKVTGAVVRGKLSLVDLAGSERAAKTGATPEQLKEAQSINKSLSALGDVISALSSDASYVPYRNNKLTMLMQDSLGGNAKTLMFVNISPVDYNTDETIVSLTYASRVKLITNSAAKNSESKEIARLKGIIAKLKKGEDIEGDDAEEDEE